MTRPGAADIIVYASAFLALLTLALINLQYPFVSDQIVALTGAKTIATGKTHQSGLCGGS